jgi:hypothetical protein
MTAKADFTEQEWELLREAPPLAGLIVITADKGGTVRETFAMAKAYTEARQQHGSSQLLDELVASKPGRDHTHHSSYEELREYGMGRLREAVALLQSKATADEVDDFRRFVLSVGDRVARQHKEGDADISEREQGAIDEITAAMA